MTTTRSRAKSPSPAPKPTPANRHWGRLLAEAVLLCLAVAVPLALSPLSRNITDVKEVVLGLGVFVGLAVWLVASLAEGRMAWPSSRVNGLLLAYLGWVAISITYSHFWYVSVSDLGRLLAGVGACWLVLASVRTFAQVRRLVFAAAAGAAIVCIYAFFQAAGVDPLWVTLKAVWGIGASWSNTEQGRVFSSIGNPTYLAGYLILLIPLVVAVGWPTPTPAAPEGQETPPRDWKPVIFFGLVLVMMVVALVLSFTFAAVGGLVLGTVYVAFLLLVRGGRKMLRTVLLVAVAAVIVLTPVALIGYRHLPAKQRGRVDRVLHFQDPSSTERQLHWRVAYGIFRDHPVLGEGYSTFHVGALERIAAAWYAQRGTRVNGMLTLNHVHNEYLQVLAETGLIGGVLFGALLIALLGLAFRVSLRHTEPQWRRVGLGVTAALIAFLVQNLFGLTFHVISCTMFFWMWVGLLVVAGSQLPRPGGGKTAPVRVRSFRRWSLPALGAATVVLGLAFWALAWYTIRPLSADVRIRLAQKLASDGQYEAAIVVARDVLDMAPYSSMAYYTLAFSYGHLGRYQEGAEASDMALKLSPGNASMYYNLGVTYKEMGQLDRAAEQFEKAIQLMPVPDHIIGLAETRLQQGRYAEAEELAQQAVDRQNELGPDPRKLADVYLMMADAASRRHDFPQVVARLQQAAGYAPDDANIQSQLVRFLDEAGRPKEALRAAQAWAKASPESLDAWRALGGLQWKLQQYDVARDTLLHVLALDSTDVRARLNLASCYARLKDLEGFRRELETIVRTGGNAPEVRTARAALAKLPPR